MKKYKGQQATKILLACIELRDKGLASQLDDFTGEGGSPTEDFRLTYIFSIRNPPIAVCAADRGEKEPKTATYLIGNRKDIERFEQKLSLI